MPSRDADAHVLEQFLRTMAPPAALTATYRQRVVRASLIARSRVISFRQIQYCVAAVIVISGALLAPGYILTHVTQTYVIPAFQVETSDVTEAVVPVLGSMHAAVEGYELSLVQSRTEAWAAAQRARRR